MSEEMVSLLMTMKGQEITLRFAAFGVTGRLLDVERQDWGYVLRMEGKAGEHLIPFPGQVMQVILPKE